MSGVLLSMHTSSCDQYHIGYPYTATFLFPIFANYFFSRDPCVAIRDWHLATKKMDKSYYTLLYYDNMCNVFTNYTTPYTHKHTHTSAVTPAQKSCKEVVKSRKLDILKTEAGIVKCKESYCSIHWLVDHFCDGDVCCVDCSWAKRKIQKCKRF